MASAMAYFQANRGKLSGQISANVVSSSRTSEGINYNIWISPGALMELESFQ